MHYTVSDTNFIYEKRVNADKHAARINGEVREVPDRTSWAMAIKARGIGEVIRGESGASMDVQSYILALLWEKV